MDALTNAHMRFKTRCNYVHPAWRHKASSQGLVTMPQTHNCCGYLFKTWWCSLVVGTATGGATLLGFHFPSSTTNANTYGTDRHIYTGTWGHT